MNGYIRNEAGGYYAWLEHSAEQDPETGRRVRQRVALGGFARRADAQAHLLVRATADDPVPPRWEAHPVGLEELAMAYLREPGAGALPGPARGRDTHPTEVTK